MNFYKRFIGDIQRDTGHLSLAEFGAYDRLLDHYYATESPLPCDVDACCRIARAMTKDERKAVTSILSQYFTKTEQGFIQKRVEHELSEAQPKIEANRLNGKLGGRPKKDKTKTQEKPTGFLNETQSEPNDNLSQSHSQNTVITNSEGNSTFPSVTTFTPTLKGEICQALVQLGLPPFNTTNPRFLALIDAQASVEEFAETAIEIRQKNPSKFSFEYLIGVIEGRRRDVANAPELHKGPMPLSAKEAGIQTAARSVFKPEHITHLTGAQEIEVQDATKHIAA